MMTALGMKGLATAILATAMIVSIPTGAGAVARADSPTPSPTATASATASPTVTATPTVTPTPTGSPDPSGYYLDNYGNLAAPLNGYFGTGSVWSTDVSQAPLDPNSAAMSSNLAAQVAQYFGGTAAFNAYSYNESEVTAPAGTPVTTLIWDNCQNKPYTPAGLFGPGGQFVDVPIPANAVPATGTDGGLAIYSPSTDQLWSFWQAKHLSDGWHACWGGRIDNVSQSPGYFANGFGATATGLSSEGGAITIRDIESGSINHAMSLAIVNPAPSNYFVWPAQRSDGSQSSTSNIPEGTRFRLDPSINVGAIPGMTKIGRMVARAAQKYGFIVTDYAGAVSVVTESGNTVKATIGTNPWDTLLGGTPTYSTMANFPWSNIQAIQAGWGQPVATPVITSISRTTGPAAGGTTVVLTGQNFVNITASLVGVWPVTSFSCATSYTCTIVTPPGSAGHYIYLTNSAGTSTASQAVRFTYTN